MIYLDNNSSDDFGGIQGKQSGSYKSKDKKKLLNTNKGCRKAERTGSNIQELKKCQFCGKIHKWGPERCSAYGHRSNNEY